MKYERYELKAKDRQKGGSLIVFLLSSFISEIVSLVSDSLLAHLLRGEIANGEKSSDSFSWRILFQSKLKLSRRIFLPLQRFFRKQTEQSLFLDGITWFLRFLFDLPLSFYGITFFSFGIYTTVFTVLVRYLNVNFQTESALTLGVALSLTFFPLLFSRKPLCASLAESRFGSFFCLKICCMREYELRPVHHISSRPTLPLLLGIGMGLLTLVISPFRLLLAFGILLCILLFFTRPEVGILALFFLLPFLPTMWVAGLMILISVGYGFRLLCGKESLRLLPGDICAIGFAAMMFLSAFVSADRTASLSPALLLTCLLAGYFVTANAIRTTETAHRCLFAVAVSSGAVSVLGILDYFLGFFDQSQTSWIDKTLFSDLTSRAVSTFENPNVLGEYLIMTVPILFAWLLVSGKFSEAGKSGILFLAALTCLVLTWSRGAWLGFFCGLLLFLLLCNRKTILVLFGTVSILPLVFSFLPATLQSRILSVGNLTDTCISYRLNIWRGCLDMAKDVWLSGIGGGTDSFRAVYPAYALEAIEDALHAHNLYLEILLELGIFGLILFVGFLFFHARSSFSFLSEDGYRKKDRILILSGLCGIFSVLVQGLTEHIWYNYRIFCFFWMLLGLYSSLISCAEREKTERRISEEMQ